MAAVEPEDVREGGVMAIRVQKHIFRVGGSLAITVPKDWLNYYGLDEGDVVEVVGNDDLVIRVPWNAVKNGGSLE